jgi:hypothetical protein
MGLGMDMILLTINREIFRDKEIFKKKIEKNVIYLVYITNLLFCLLFTNI